MESRIRDGQNKLIDVFALLVRGENNNPIVWSYPENGLNEELQRTVPKFAFPFREDFKSSNIDYFTFVLTDIDGKFKFGFCRMSAGSESTLCLISSYPWFEIFSKILNHLADANNSTTEVLTSLLQELSEIDPSVQGSKFLSYKFSGTPITITYPDPDRLPSIPENRNLTEYYNAFDGYNMLVIFASMLFERRIIVTSRKLSRLTACVYAATSLIYPLNWQHIFIPVLPFHLIEYISAPMPYLIGVHSSVFEAAKPGEIDDAVIVDADAGKVKSSHADLSSLPPSVLSALKKDLKLHRHDNHCSLTGDKLSQAFLNAMVTLIGGYRRALVQQGGKISFSPEVFVRSCSARLQPFIQRILESQSFEQFIEERLALSKHQRPFSDIFEDAVRISEAKEKQGRSVKNKMNHIIQEKVLTDIKKKVKSTSVKTLSSVKRKLDMKKNGNVDGGGKGKGISYPAYDVAVQPIVIAPSAEVLSSATAGDAEPLGGLPVTSFVVRRQFSSPRSPSLNHHRHSLLMSLDVESDLLDPIRKRSNSDLLTEQDKTDLFKKYSYDDLRNSEADTEHDIITLSSCSLESNQDVTTSNFAQVYNEHPSDGIIPGNYLEMEEKIKATEESSSTGMDDDSQSSADKEFEEGQSDRDSVFEMQPRNLHEVCKNLNSAPLLMFPSVRQLTKALQTSNPIKRKAIISVQELPNVRQIVEKFEASCKPKQTIVTTTSSHAYRKPLMENGMSSFVTPQCSSPLDRKSRTSLTRRHAMRATAALRVTKPPGNEDTDDGDSGNVQKMENRSVFMGAAEMERYQDLVDSVKKEEKLLPQESKVDQHPNGFGCLLRVSTRSASMRQFDMERSRFSAIKRDSPLSEKPRRKVQRSRQAIYQPVNTSDSEANEAINETPVKPSDDRHKVHIPFHINVDHETTTDINVGSSEHERSENTLCCPSQTDTLPRSIDTVDVPDKSNYRNALLITFQPKNDLEPHPDHDPRTLTVIDHSEHDEFYELEREYEILSKDTELMFQTFKDGLNSFSLPFETVTLSSHDTSEQSHDLEFPDTLDRPPADGLNDNISNYSANEDIIRFSNHKLLNSSDDNSR